MARYFFDFEIVGGGFFDHEGTDLPDDSAAFAHAASDARHIIGDLLRHDRPVAHRTIIIRDQHRKIIGRVAFADIYRQLAAEA